MIAWNLNRIRQRLVSICDNSGRRLEDITIVAVTKGIGVEEIRQAIAVGINDLGENKVQEARDKYNALNSIGHKLNPVRWHMIGHLQTNKVKDAIAIFDLIHSVDSVRLARCIDRAASNINKVQDILIEVNSSGELAKFGFSPLELSGAIEEVSELRNINIMGLMTIAPVADAPEKARPYFRMLRELKDKINRSGNLHLSLLSMGMSDDFEIAAQEGSNMLRLGRAIFSGD